MKTVERARGDERQQNRRSELFEQQIETRFSAISKPILVELREHYENQLIPTLCWFQPTLEFDICYNVQIVIKPNSCNVHFVWVLVA